MSSSRRGVDVPLRNVREEGRAPLMEAMVGFVGKEEILEPRWAFALVLAIATESISVSSVRPLMLESMELERARGLREVATVLRRVG